MSKTTWCPHTHRGVRAKRQRLVRQAQGHVVLAHAPRGPAKLNEPRSADDEEHDTPPGILPGRAPPCLYDPRPGTSPGRAPPYAPSAKPNEPRSADDEEHDTPPGTSPGRAPGKMSSAKPNEPRSAEDKENAKERETRPVHTEPPLAQCNSIHTRP